MALSGLCVKESERGFILAESAETGAQGTQRFFIVQFFALFAFLCGLCENIVHRVP
jgi:hypothetical protein